MAQPAGWYADPSGLPARRWWDGRQWTDQIQPGGEPIPPPNGYFPPVPPSGPPMPDQPSYVSAVPENATILRSETSGPSEPPPPHPEVPAAPFTMPPVDTAARPAPLSASPHPVQPSAADTPLAAAPSRRAGDSRRPDIAHPTEPDDLEISRQQRIAGFVGLALIAVLVLALTAVILLA